MGKITKLKLGKNKNIYVAASAAILILIIVVMTFSVLVKGLVSTSYSAIGKTITSRDTFGNPISSAPVSQPVCMRWPSCEDEIAPVPLSDAITSNSFEVKSISSPFSEGTSVQIYQMPANTATSGYVSSDGNWVIPPKSGELKAYEASVGIVTIPQVTIIRDPATQTTTTIVGYMVPAPKLMEPGGYWYEGVYYQPDGKSHLEVWKESVSQTDCTANRIDPTSPCMGYVAGVGWIALDVTGTPKTDERPRSMISLFALLFGRR